MSLFLKPEDDSYNRFTKPENSGQVNVFDKPESNTRFRRQPTNNKPSTLEKTKEGGTVSEIGSRVKLSYK